MRAWHRLGQKPACLPSFQATDKCDVIQGVLRDVRLNIHNVARGSSFQASMAIALCMHNPQERRLGSNVRITSTYYGTQYHSKKVRDKYISTR